MSADNGIYISKFDDGYRVIHAQAIENLSNYPDDSLEERLMWVNYFKHAVDVHESIELALQEAMGMLKTYIVEGDVCEHGIQLLANAPIPSKLLKRKKAQEL